MTTRPGRQDERAARARLHQIIADLKIENAHLIEGVNRLTLEKVALQDQLRKTQGIAT